jgi:cobalt/nickel transport system ATP-binding protein
MTKALEIRGLRYSYPDGSAALNGIDLDVYEKECVALIGPNGAGKSTLIMHLNGLLSPDSGSVKIFGEELNGKNKAEFRKMLNIVFEDPDSQLFSPTVFDDVAFGPLNMGLPKEEVSMRVREALANVGMSGFESRSPHHLSFGEKKRVSIATVLSMRPMIMVLDEPTLGLDPWGRKDFIGLLKGLKRDRTLIISTHDLGLLEFCHRAYLLKDGRVERELDENRNNL